MTKTTEALEKAAHKLLRELDDCLHENDYCGLQVSKHDRAAVDDAIEGLRVALSAVDDGKARAEPDPSKCRNRNYGQWVDSCDYPECCKSAPAPDAGDENANRYRVEKWGAFGWCVKCGDGTRNLFVGRRDACEHVAAELLTAFRDGEFLAAPPQPAEKASELEDRIGQMLSDKLIEMTDSCTAQPDWYDARNVDELVDAVVAALASAPQADQAGELTDAQLDALAWQWVSEKLTLSCDAHGNPVNGYRITEFRMRMFARAAIAADRAARAAVVPAADQAGEREAVTVTVEKMVESVNGVSWWVVLRRGKHRQDDGKYGADYKNRAEWHAAGLRWILGQGPKPYIGDAIYADPPAASEGDGQ